tara:strand:+ start:701 stop:835 length:135 start_codon:yes stop_codon:yes gene_type:complete
VSSSQKQRAIKRQRETAANDGEIIVVIIIRIKNRITSRVRYNKY